MRSILLWEHSVPVLDPDYCLFPREFRREDGKDSLQGELSLRYTLVVRILGFVPLRNESSEGADFR
jgi:hypothetical protein